MARLTERLNEAIVADAFEDRRIVDGRLAERLIYERKAAAETIRCLTEAMDGLLTSLSLDDDEGLMEHAEPVERARAAIAKAREDSSND